MSEPQQEKQQAQKEGPTHCLLSYHLQRALNDYLEEFRLPKCVGHSAKVISVLSKRIEKGLPLSVANVSSDLGVSTQTLHRRLVSEGYAYQHLLDQVKRHYAFSMLIHNVPAENISDTLQYESLKCFEFSFIRWTGLDPDAFQRLFCRSTHPESL